MRKRSFMLFSLICLGGCLLGPTYKQPELELPQNGQPGDTFGIFTTEKWWTVFVDPV